MAREKDSESKVSGLRIRAEEFLGRKASEIEDIASLSPEEIQRLVHELRVHQIELEMQNEDLRQSQIEAEQLKDRYLDLYDFAPVGYVALDVKGIILEANLTVVRLLGAERQNLTKTFFSRFVSQEFGDAFYFHLQKVFETQSKQTCEIQMARKDGAHFYAQLETVPVRDESRRLNECRTIVSDITDRKRAEDARQDSEGKLKAVVDGSPIPQFVIDQNHTLIHWNKALEEISGIKATEVIGTKQYWRAFYNEERPCMADLLVDGDLDRIPHWYGAKYSKSTLITDAYEATDSFPMLDNEVKWLHFTAAAIRDSKGNIMGAVETLEDITERRQHEGALRKSKEELETKVLERTEELRKANGQLQLELTERKKVEEDLRKSEEHYRTILKTAIDGFWLVDMMGRILEVNDAYCKIVGYSREELLGMNVADLEVSETREEVAAHIQKVFSKGSDRFETVHRRRNGSNAQVEVAARFLPGDGGLLFIFLRDITDHKRAEEALRENEERLSLAVEVSNAGTWEWIIERDEVCLDARFHVMLGYTPGELPNTIQEWLPYHHPGDMPIWMSKAQAYLHGDSPVYESEHRVRTKAGTWAWVFTRGKLVNGATAGSPNRFTGMAIDITDRKRAEEAILASEEKYRTLFEESFDGLFITSPGGKILDMNKKGVAMFGYDTKEDVLSLDLERDVYAHPPDRKRIFAMVNARGSAEYEVVVKKKNGEEMITHCALTAVKDETGVITSYRGIIRDITELVKTQARVENERARLRTLVQTIPDLVWLKDPDGVYLTCNPRFERFFGAKESDIVGKTDYDFVDADLADFFRDHDRKAIDAGKPSINEEWVTFADDGHRELLETIKTPDVRQRRQPSRCVGHRS